MRFPYYIDFHQNSVSFSKNVKFGPNFNMTLLIFNMTMISLKCNYSIFAAAIFSDFYKNQKIVGKGENKKHNLTLIDIIFYGG